MSTLIESYNDLILKVKKINDNINMTEQKISELSKSFSGNVSTRIEKLEEQLIKIDEYLLKIRGFQELAKKNLDSQNILTIEAPPGYRVNLNRLRNWAMMIDPMSSNDPYAQRVFVVSKCDEYFLLKKQKEFKERIEELKTGNALDSNSEIIELKQYLNELKNELKSYAGSEELKSFAIEVVNENLKYWNKTSPIQFEPVQHNHDTAVTAPGAYAAPFSFDKEQRTWLKTLMGDFYDSEGGHVLLPVEIKSENEYVLTISCSPSRRNQLDRGIQNLVLSTINNNPVGKRKIVILDGVRYNSSSLNSLKELEGSFAIEHIPRNPDQMTETLENIVSLFADVDEVLDQFDSVAEYNSTVEDKDKIPAVTLIIYGWPNSFQGRDRELLQRIMINYERYGISIIAISYQNSEKNKERDKDPMPEFAKQNAIHISMFKKGTTITQPEGNPQRFTWYSFTDSLSKDYIQSVLMHKIVDDSIGNEYVKRYSLTDLPQYERNYKKIDLPFGIDGKDQAHSISFENENFATYLVGASRSGKSTLLHTLIAGLIRNYHPDNVELWLADFKQLEFKRYIKHLPPHVKYILLDESTELVFDLVDKLNNEMLERQKLFSRLGVQRIDQIDPVELSKPLPVIFVILDEFSIMSQSIAESETYRLKLQNLLAKGAALGIKFLFSSQTFTTGVKGLTPTARAQIQQRIAMKGSKEEISETLELSPNLKTEQVKNWMDALPPHYALVKFRISADTLPLVKRFLVMYFPDYDVRDKMIENINHTMHSVNEYNPSDINAFVDKHPVLVDGNTYDAFNNSEFLKFRNKIINKDNQDYSGDEMLISFGTPRLMVKMNPAMISSETRENILLIARAAEQMCAASIMLSAIKSYKLQQGNVEIWAYGKNRLFKAYKNVFLQNDVNIVEDIDSVCDSIYELKNKILNKQTSNTLIVLIGMDRICMDFDYVDGNISAHQEKEGIAEKRAQFAANGATVQSDEDEQRRKYALKWGKYKKPYVEKAKAEGKTQEEIKEMTAELEKHFREQEGKNLQRTKPHNNQQIAEDQQSKEKKKSNFKKHPSGAYNAKEDLKYVIRQGSRMGYHFLLGLNSYSDLKQCGLKVNDFRYRLAFQISVDDSRDIFNNKIASTLPEHICQFDDTLERYSFRPYLHEGIGWDGWFVAENGKVINPYSDE